MVDDKGNLSPKFKNVEQGAATTVWAAVSEELENKGGLYLDNCGLGVIKSSMQEAYNDLDGYLPHALDEKNADRLWELSEKWLENPPNN